MGINFYYFFKILYRNNNSKYKDNIEFLNDYFLIYDNCIKKDLEDKELFGNVDSKYPLCVNKFKKTSYKNSIVLRSGSQE